MAVFVKAAMVFGGKWNTLTMEESDTFSETVLSSITAKGRRIILLCMQTNMLNCSSSVVPNYYVVYR